ncbi:MAG: GGDEF domain-containing protein [Proteobacteria bacterium]|nr:GGDEF domain-containing protein [Pseudomonadota bacterium]
MKYQFKDRSAQSKMLLMLSFGAFLGVLPFTIFRFIQQDWAIAFLDTIIVLGMAGVFIYVYKTDNVKKASLVFVLIALLGNVIAFYLKGISQMNWIYPSMFAAYYVMSPKQGMAFNFVMLSLYLPKLFSLMVSVNVATVIVTIIITNIFAYVFSSGLRSKEIILKKMASEDYLTSTGNRRSLKFAMNKLYKALKNSDKTAAIILLDLDHFKQVNDTYGHIKGDEVLVRLSELLKGFFQDKDSVFRFGGEEFLVICRDVSKQKAHDMAEEFRIIVKNNIVIEKKQQTISLGVCEYSKHKSIEQWIHRVDLALYQAKKQGRDRTISA